MLHSPPSNLSTLASTKLPEPSSARSSPFALPIHPRKNSPEDPLPPLHPPTQSVKREILSKTRSDWTWPSPPTNSDSQTSQRLTTTTTTTTTQWRPRDSDSDSDTPPPSPHASNPSSGSTILNPYKYDNPDSLGQSIQVRRQARHRRHRQEMEWNEGLATYTQRRDSWTGARVFPPDSFSDGDLSNITTGPACPPPPATPLRSSSPSSHSPLLPLPPPLLAPTHPIRASITPSTYPVIYSKVVVQGLSPNVPINLSDMVCALVQGWKEKGEWPPRGAGEVDNTTGNKGGGGDATAEASNGARNTLTRNQSNSLRTRTSDASLSTPLSPKAPGPGIGLRRGVGRVRKAFGLGLGLGNEDAGGGGGR